MKLRETDKFTAEESPRGVRITSKDSTLTPRTRVVRRKQDYDNYLATLEDETFDAACVWDFGIAAFIRTPSKPTEYA